MQPVEAAATGITDHMDIATTHVISAFVTSSKLWG